MIPLNRRFIRLAGMIAMAACARAHQSAGTLPSILEAKGDSLRLRLVDAMTAQPIANAEIEIQSDNGIRCIKAPCPTHGNSWKGRSDASGIVVIPKGALNTTARLRGAAHQGDLIEDVEPNASGGWTAELFPEERADPPPHPLKLVDARTHRPIANATVRIEARAPGVPVEEASATTNALGYILVPSLVFEKSPEHSWLVTPGYRDAHIDFAYARRKTLLVPR